jgi:hypothetical protein
VERREEGGREVIAHESGRDVIAHESGREVIAHESGREAIAHESGREAIAHESGRDVIAPLDAIEAASARDGRTCEERDETAAFLCSHDRVDEISRT